MNNIDTNNIRYKHLNSLFNYLNRMGEINIPCKMENQELITDEVLPSITDSPSRSRFSFDCGILPEHPKMHARSEIFLRAVQVKPAGFLIIKLERRSKK